MAYSKQTWHDLPDQTTPINAERLNYMEDGIYNNSLKIVDEYSEAQDRGYSANYINNNFETKGTLLWTNPNPSSTMGNTDITVQDMSNYDMLEIFYYDYAGIKTMCSARAKKGELINLMTIFQASNGGYVGNRVVTYINSTTLRFNDPVSIIINDNLQRQAVNDWCIPLYIVGYKTGLFN